MATLKCTQCGADIEVTGDKKSVTCATCNATQEVILSSSQINKPSPVQKEKKKPSEAQIAEALEKREMLYQAAVKLMKAGNYTKVLPILKILGNYKDAPARLSECEQKLAAQKKKKRKILILASSIASGMTVVCIALLILTFTLFLPLGERNDAYDYIERGDFALAKDVLTELNGFSDTETDLKVLYALDTIEGGNLVDGIKEILAGGVPVTVAYNTAGGTLSQTTADRAGNISLLSASSAPSEHSSVTYENADTFSALSSVTRNGFVFDRWALNGYTYTPDDPKAVTISVTAIWETVGYNISYDLGGGKAVSNPENYDYDTPDFTLNNPMRTGYEFAGWTGTGLTKPTEEVTIRSGNYGDRTYTATWKPNTYSIILKQGDGTSKSEIVTVTYDQAYTLPTPTRLGYTFLGWYRDESKHYSGTWKLTDDLTLTAKWKIITYTIGYTLDGGIASNPDSYSVASETITLNSPKRAGYTFAGWTGTDLTEPTMQVTIPKGSVGVRGYKAHWQPLTHKVTCVFNDDTTENQVIDVTFDQPYELPTPTRFGYIFDGWYKNGQKYTSGTWRGLNDITLEASWSIKRIPILYSPDKNIEENPDYYTLFEDSFTLIDGGREGYTFLGWTYEGVTTPTKNVKIQIDINDPKYYTFTSHWEANTYTITFDAMGGEISPTTQKVVYDTAFTLPAPTREGYTFNRWMPTPSGGLLHLGETWTEPTDITLYASWTANKYQVTLDGIRKNECTVTFANENLANPVVKQVTLKAGDTLPYEKITMSGNQYLFLGWYTENTYVNRYNFDTPITSDMTLYAKFQKAPKTILTYLTSTPFSTTMNYMCFVPQADCTVTITSDSPLYNEGGLYDENKQLLAAGVPDSKNINFSITYEVKAWQLYYVGFRARMDGLQGISLKMEGAEYPVSTAIVPGADYLQEEGSQIVLSATYDKTLEMPVPVREGYTFLGWYDGDTKVESDVWNIASDVTLTAKWQKNE